MVPALSILFLLATVVLVIADLKRPERVWRMVFRPNLRSWLVWGTYILIVLGLLDLAWLIVGPASADHPLIWLTVLFGIAGAGYTGFLFGQAEARDLWQSPLFTLHLVIKAALAGLGSLILVGLALGSAVPGSRATAVLLAVLIALNLVIIALELTVKHGTLNAKLAAEFLVKDLGAWFWTGVIAVGAVLPLLVLALGPVLGIPLVAGVASALALVGLAIFDDLFIKAGQAPPIS